MLSCAIIGTGPSALTAATFLTRAGIKPVLFERRAAPGWKLLVAGSSGLNVTYDCPDEELVSHFSARRNELGHCLQRFPRSEWLKLLTELGEEPYVGSSHRYFLRNKTAATLLAAWAESLSSAGAEFRYGEELVEVLPGSPLTLKFASGLSIEAQTALLALGGGSWETEPPAWPEMLKKLGLEGSRLEPSNAGYSFAAPQGFFEENEGKPIKGLVLTTSRGKRQGELMITKYGLEGTPVYTVGCPGPAHLDLKPDLAEDKLVQKIASGKGSMMSRIENTAKLSPGALAMLKA
ncbi:MAG: NAD(P)/FAD-dependent oxidoreductase, partial [Bdellovibrionota bacterium]